MEQLVIVLLIGLVSLIRWLMEKSAEARQKRAAEAQQSRTDRGDAETEPPEQSFGLPDADEAARRLREALGLPPDVAPPPRRTPPPIPGPARPQSPAIPPVPPFVESPRPAAPSVFERKLREYEEDLERRRIELPAPPPVAEPPPRPVRPMVAAKPDAGPASTAASPLAELLRSREGLRKAILVREVLGPPKGLTF